LTDFDNGANPVNLPGGNNLSPPFVATDTFSVDAQGNPSLGINPGDTLLLTIGLLPGLDYADTIAALNAGLLGQDTLRIGLHVRSIGTEGRAILSLYGQIQCRNRLNLFWPRWGLLACRLAIAACTDSSRSPNDR
jgi:hypothetical protein